MLLYNLSNMSRPWYTVSAFGVAGASNDLSLLSSSSTLWMVGCDLPGKLIDRTWLGFEERAAISYVFFFSDEGISRTGD